VKLDDRPIWAYLPNSGRLEELLRPQQRVFLKPVPVSHRKTGYDLALVEIRGTLVSTDARLPNLLVKEALREGALSPFRGYRDVQREVRYRQSHLDFALVREEWHCLIEVKSVTLVQDGIALFPDAPTLRGRRHVEELHTSVAEGGRTAIIFAVQRGDARAFSDNGRADPSFGRALRWAIRGG